MCDCPSCKESEEMRKVIVRKDPDELIKKIGQLTDRLCCLAEEHSIQQAIYVECTWPTSVLYIISALKKATRISRERGYDKDLMEKNMYSKESIAALTDKDKLWDFIHSK